MKIEIWSDILCPFCHIGKRRLEAALATFPSREAFEVAWRAFELDPGQRSGEPGGLYKKLATKYGRSEAQAKQMCDDMTGMAAQEGLSFDFSRAVPANSFDAHRLAKLAALRGKEDAAQERLFSAYLSRGEDISDRATLARIGAELGLDAGEVEQALSGDAFADEVRRDEAEAATLGVHAVPFFVIDRRLAVSGAQPSEVFSRALQRAWESRPAMETLGEADAVCDETGCRLPER